MYLTKIQFSPVALSAKRRCQIVSVVETNNIRGVLYGADVVVAPKSTSNRYALRIRKQLPMRSFTAAKQGGVYGLFNRLVEQQMIPPVYQPDYSVVNRKPSQALFPTGARVTDPHVTTGLLPISS